MRFSNYKLVIHSYRIKFIILNYYCKSESKNKNKQIYLNSNFKIFDPNNQLIKNQN